MVARRLTRNGTLWIDRTDFAGIANVVKELFGKKTMDMRIPFERPAEGMKNADETYFSFQ